MPEHIRSLIVILFLATVTFVITRKVFVGNTITSPQLNRWRNAWYAMTLIVFLSNDFWLYIVLATLYILLITRNEKNLLMLYVFLLFAVPNLQLDIPGGGLIKYLFTLDYLRLLALTILLPAYISLRSKRDTLRFGKMKADIFLLLYILVHVGLYLKTTTFTDTLRQGLYSFCDFFLPYYVASRSLKSINDIKTVATAYLIPSLIMSLILVFELGRSWLLYSYLQYALDAPWTMGSYIARDGLLRAVASFGQPIVAAFAMVMAAGFYYFIAPSLKKTWIKTCIPLVLAGGIIAPLSRGPWIGAVVLAGLIVLTGKKPIKRLLGLALASFMLLSVVSITPVADKVFNLLPFIGKTDTENIEYRQRLLDKTFVIMKNNFWFGDVLYRESKDMKDMIQGEGIVDIVNSYTNIVLENGVVALFFYVGFFLFAMGSIYLSMLKMRDKASDDYRLGRALLAMLISALTMIFTVSSIMVIPIICFLLAGIGVALAQITTKQLATSKLNAQKAHLDHAF